MFRMRHFARVAAAMAVILGALAGVLINVWTAGWYWPVGVGLLVTVACSAALAWWSAASSHGATRLRVRQRLGSVTAADAVALKGAAGQDDVDVGQTIDQVRNSTIVGYDSRTDSPKS
jgi:hypothetical protein